MRRREERSGRFRWRVFPRRVRFSAGAWDGTWGRRAKYREEFRATAEEEEKRVRGSRTRRGRWRVRRWSGIQRRKRARVAGRRPGCGPCERNAAIAVRSCRRDAHGERTTRTGG